MTVKTMTVKTRRKEKDKNRCPSSLYLLGKMINQLLYNKIINLHFIIFPSIIGKLFPDNKHLLKQLEEADESTFERLKVRAQSTGEKKPKTGWNYFQKKFCSSTDAEGYKISVRNKMASAKWKSMNNDEQKKYEPVSFGHETETKTKNVVKIKSAYTRWADDERRTNPLFLSMTTTEKQSFTLQLKQMWKNNPVLQAPYQIKAAELIILKYDGLEGKLNNYSFEVVN